MTMKAVELPQRLNAKFHGDIYKVKDGTRVPDDEYIVFLAKDNAFALTLPHYRTYCIGLGCDEEHIALVDELIERVNEWRRANPHRLKNPDAKGEETFYKPREKQNAKT